MNKYMELVKKHQMEERIDDKSFCVIERIEQLIYNGWDNNTKLVLDIRDICEIHLEKHRLIQLPKCPSCLAEEE